MYKALFFLFALIFIACQKHDVPVEKTTLSIAPDPFLIYILKTTSSTATISWDKATDQDNDIDYYTIFLNNVVVFDRIKTDTLLTINHLNPDTDYSGKINVTDKQKNITSVPFVFKTTKYAIEFDRLYPIEYQLAYGNCIKKTNDGGYVVGGNLSFGNGYDTFVLKLDSLGYQQWHTICKHHLSGLVQIRQTVDGGFILIDEAKLIRLDKNGTELWRYPQIDVTQGYRSLCVTKDNYFIVVRGVTGFTDVLMKASVIKFDENGSIIWEKTFGTQNRTEACQIEPTAEGNLMVVGTEDKWIFITKMSKNGDIIWKKSIYSDLSQFTNYLSPTKDNGFVIATSTMGLSDETNVQIIKLDQDGKTEWIQTFAWDSFYTSVRSIKQTSDGGYLFCGGNGYSPRAALLVKLNEGGILVWKKEYYPDEMDFSWEARDLEITLDNGIALVGSKGHIWSDPTDKDGLWVLKTNEFGEKK